MWHRRDDPFRSTGRPGREVHNQLTEIKLIHHNLDISKTRYIEKVFTNVQQKLNRLEGDQMLDLRVNVFIYMGLFMFVTMKAVIHLGEDCTENLVACRAPTSMRSRRCSTSCRS